MSALKGMFSFFTMIRLDITQDDMDDMDRNFHLAPVVGIFYGLVAAVLMFLFSHISIFVAAVLTLFILQIINRFLHIDGTIDLGDGLVVAGTREDHMRALKDTRIGAGGMAFALFVIVLSIAAMSSIGGNFIIMLPFMAEVLAKNSMVAAAAFGTSGDGMAGNSVRNTNSKSIMLASLISYPAVAVMALILGESLGMIIILFGMTLISILTGFIMSRISDKTFGMTNGDVLGATNEISRVVTLVAMLVIISVI